MRIVIVDTTVHGTAIGGGHLIVSSLLSGLVSRGHDVHYVSTASPNPTIADSLAVSGASLHQGIWPRTDIVSDATPVFSDWLQDLSPDVYVVSASGDLGWTVLPRLPARIATVMIGHSNSRGFYDPLRHYASFMTRCVGVSEEICEKFKSYSGVEPDRISWIPYGVQVSGALPAENSGALCLCYVGRLEEADKRAMDVARIALGLNDVGIDYHMEVMGHGSLYAPISEMLDGSIELGKVSMRGWLSEDEVIALLRKQDLFLLTSSSEGFPIALVQAMANGCSAVVTDIPSGTRRLVRDGENGFVVPIGDIEAFVARIKVLAGDRQRLMSMRREAWETGREYSIERMVDGYQRCFETAIENARADPRQPDATFPLMPSCRSKYPLWLRRIKAKATGFAR
jgi:glycosyltransferase involved in cell wall biosynthesis